MYPPNERSGEYSALPTDAEGGVTYANRYSSSPFKRRLYALTKKPVFKLILVGVLFFFLISLFFHSRTTPSGGLVPVDVTWPEEAFQWNGTTKPSYITDPWPSNVEPIVIRLAIMSRVDEFERRQALRDTVLTGIPETHVKLTYKFFVGRAPGGVMGLNTKLKLSAENSKYNDIIILDQIADIPERLSEKRYWAIKWTAQVPQTEYDYSMTLDSDTFTRFSVIAQRLRHVYPGMKPREQPIILARMSVHHAWYTNTLPDGNPNDKDEDPHVMGPWYKYPIGIGYMLSSNLTSVLLSLDPPLPHHINYPSDDVMIGSWVAGLFELHNPDATCETDEIYGPKQPAACPKPYLPWPMDATWIDDIVGWHDFNHRGSHDHPIGWETACVHRLSAKEMVAFRQMDQVKDEWVTPKIH